MFQKLDITISFQRIACHQSDGLDKNQKYSRNITIFSSISLIISLNLSDNLNKRPDSTFSLMSRRDSISSPGIKTPTTTTRLRKKILTSYNHLSLAPKLDTENFERLYNAKKDGNQRDNSPEPPSIETKYNELVCDVKELHHELLKICLTEVKSEIGQ